jgi:predicted nucleic acid-binding protein
MKRIILLDAAPLGMVTNPRATKENSACQQWVLALLAADERVLVPEIADYEVRRELLRAGKRKGIDRLDRWKTSGAYIPLTTETMLQAAEFWATARQQGQPTAMDAALDGDVILAAQAVLLARQGADVVVATSNVRHISRFTNARQWEDIHPIADDSV